MGRCDEIDAFCLELERMWKQDCPGWRFGQIMIHTAGIVGTNFSRLALTSDKDMLRHIGQLLRKHSGRY